MQVTEITRDHIQAYLTDGLCERSPATMRSYMIVMRCFFRWLAEEGWVRFDPARAVKLPKARARQRDCLWPEQVAPVLAACRRVCPNFAPIAMAIMLGSFRKGEVVNLRRADMNCQPDVRWTWVLDWTGDDHGPCADPHATPWTTKSEHSRRAVPLHPHLAETLACLPPVFRSDGTRSPWVFPVLDNRRKARTTDRRGRIQPIRGDRRSPNTTWFGKCLRAALAEAGIDHRVTVHGLRRTFAVLLQEAGAPEYIIRQAMGHAPKGVTAQHYLPRRDPVLQRWIDRITIPGWQPSVQPRPNPVATPICPRIAIFSPKRNRDYIPHAVLRIEKRQ